MSSALIPKAFCCLLLIATALIREAGGGDPCSSRPCKNNGKCLVKKKSYFCVCGMDFAGDNCEQDLTNKEAHFEPKTTSPLPEETQGQQVTEPGYSERTFFAGEIQFGRVTEAPPSIFGEEGMKKMRIGYSGKLRITMDTTYMGCTSEEFLAAQVIGVHLGIKLMTIEMCITLCRWTRFNYAALSGATDCRCRNYYNPSALTDEKECRFMCAGNNSQICGGNNKASIYTTCPMGFYGETCRYQCRCALYQCNIEDGTCPTNACKYGWKGPSCEDFDLPVIHFQTTSWIILVGYGILTIFITVTSAFFIFAYRRGNVAWTEGNLKSLMDTVRGIDTEQKKMDKKMEEDMEKLDAELKEGEEATPASKEEKSPSSGGKKKKN